MNIFQRAFDAITHTFSQELHLSKTVSATPFQVQSRMWFKLTDAPSKREAEFFRKVGEMGAEIARVAKSKHATKTIDETRCVLCHGIITSGTGYTILRDVLLARNKKIPWQNVRELCKECNARLTWNLWENPKDLQVLFERRNVIQ